MCRDIKVRLCTRVSTCDLDLQLSGREGRGAGTSCLSTISNPPPQRGENIPAQLAALPQVARAFSRMLRVHGAWGWEAWELARSQQARDLGLQQLVSAVLTAGILQQDR